MIRILIDSTNSSRAPSPATDSKRKIVNDALAGPSKKPKLDLPNFIPGKFIKG